MKRALAAIMLLTCAPAYAVLPQAMTVIMHFMGGFAIAKITDELGGSQNAGLAVATGVGLAKELTDLNFNGPDFIAWPLGAWVYRVTKDMPGCFELSDADQYNWYISNYRSCDKVTP